MKGGHVDGGQRVASVLSPQRTEQGGPGRAKIHEKPTEQEREQGRREEREKKTHTRSACTDSPNEAQKMVVWTIHVTGQEAVATISLSVGEKGVRERPSAKTNRKMWRGCEDPQERNRETDRETDR